MIGGISGCGLSLELEPIIYIKYEFTCCELNFPCVIHPATTKQGCNH